MKYKTLVIFAHPDDEVLWMGGFMIKYRDYLKVDFVCLTHPFNKTRIKGLMRLDEHFDCGKIICLGYEDDPAVYRQGKAFHFDDEWLEGIDFNRYDLVFSHNHKGEYGHPHHKYLHNTLTGNSIDFISFGHESNADFDVLLTKKEHDRKQNIMRDLYEMEVNRLLTCHPYWYEPYEHYKFEGDKGRFSTKIDEMLEY